MNIKQQLLDDLNDHEFCHHSIIGLEQVCSDWLYENSGLTGDNYKKILIYIIRSFCFSVRDRIDAVGPVAVETHNKIEQAVLGPLKNAINTIDSNNAQECLDAIGKLMDSEIAMKEVSNPQKT